MKNLRVTFDFDDWENLNIKKNLVNREAEEPLHKYNTLSAGRRSENPQDDSGALSNQDLKRASTSRMRLLTENDE